jgi:spoIIIJ-associated protein
MITDNSEALQAILTEMLEKMGFTPGAIAVTPGNAEGQYLCAITIAEGQNFLIGQYGMNLAALQHLVRIIARKQIGERLDIVVDINEYFAEKKQLLEKEAKEALNEALQNNISVALRPMLPYERKIVHAYLSLNESVMTESVGSGEERKVMVRPKPLASE